MAAMGRRVLVDTEHSLYLLDEPLMIVLRMNRVGGELRRDGENSELLAWPVITVGESMTLMLRGVAEDPSIVTVRMTSPVVKITRERAFGVCVED